MKNYEIERNAPLTAFEKVSAGVSILWSLFFALAVSMMTGCGKSVDVEGKGMYANANSGVVGIGSFEVVTVPDGNEAARIQYSEDTAWLSPSTKTHAFKINLSGSNSVDQVGGIVGNICQAFIATAPQIAAINSGAEVSAPTNGPGAIVSAAISGTPTETVAATTNAVLIGEAASATNAASVTVEATTAGTNAVPIAVETADQESKE